MAAEREAADWDDYSYVISSQYRLAVVQALEAGPSTPSGIARDADVRITHISRALRELRERGLVELLVAEETVKGRVYALSDAGEAAAGLVGDHYGGDEA